MFLDWSDWWFFKVVGVLYWVVIWWLGLVVLKVGVVFWIRFCVLEICCYLFLEFVYDRSWEYCGVFVCSCYRLRFRLLWSWCDLELWEDCRFFVWCESVILVVYFFGVGVWWFWDWCYWGWWGLCWGWFLWFLFWLFLLVGLVLWWVWRVVVR